MIFSEAQKGSLVSRLSFLESELRELAGHQGLEWQSYLEDKPLRRNIERMIENIVNALVDVGKIILSDKTAGEIPATYGEVILKLSEFKIIDFDLAQCLAEHVKLRNYLAHQYLDLRWDKVKQFLQQAPEQFGQFILQVKRHI